MKLNLTPYNRAPETKQKFNFSEFICKQVMKKKSPIMVMPYTKVAVYTTLREYIARWQYPLYLMKIGNQMIFLRTDMDIPEVRLPTKEDRGIENTVEEAVEEAEEVEEVEQVESPVSEYDFDEEEDDGPDDTVEALALPALVKAKPVKAVAKKPVAKKTTPLEVRYTPADIKAGKANKASVLRTTTPKGKVVRKVARTTIDLSPAVDVMG